VPGSYVRCKANSRIDTVARVDQFQRGTTSFRPDLDRLKSRGGVIYSIAQDGPKTDLISTRFDTIACGGPIPAKNEKRLGFGQIWAS
jgi:hypothetical protein